MVAHPIGGSNRVLIECTGQLGESGRRGMTIGNNLTRRTAIADNACLRHSSAQRIGRGGPPNGGSGELEILL